MLLSLLLHIPPLRIPYSVNSQLLPHILGLRVIPTLLQCWLMATWQALFMVLVVPRGAIAELAIVGVVVVVECLQLVVLSKDYQHNSDLNIDHHNQEFSLLNTCISHCSLVIQ